MELQLYIYPFGEEEVRMAAKYFEKNKAPGIDGKSPIALKLFNNHLIYSMDSCLLP